MLQRRHHPIDSIASYVGGATGWSEAEPTGGVQAATVVTVGPTVHTAAQQPRNGPQAPPQPTGWAARPDGERDTYSYGLDTAVPRG